MTHSPLVEQLDALDLAQVAVSATIDARGNLGPVGGLWPKLLAAARQAADLGVLRMVVVSDVQGDVPADLLKPDAAPLRVLKAATLAEVVACLYEEHGPRAAVRMYERRLCAQMDLLDAKVSLEAHYQVLPLLQEVKRERLPREPRSPDSRDGQPDTQDRARGKGGRADDRHRQSRHAEDVKDQRLEGDERRLREAGIIAWEEKLREETVHYKTVALDRLFGSFREMVKDAKSDAPRCVVLGPPGSGKSTLAQYLAWRAASGTLRLGDRLLVPGRVRLRDWEAWAIKPAAPDKSLPAYLAHCYRDIPGAPVESQWRAWLQRGDVLLLLDGLDEVAGAPTFLTALEQALGLFPNCAVLMTCRTVSFEQHRALCPHFPVFTLAGLDDAGRNAYITAYPAQHPERFDAAALIQQLERTPAMRPLAANPLLLSIICFVVDDPQGVSLPATRGQLYDKAVDKLLARRRLEPTAGVPEVRRRRILERAALALFASSEEWQLVFDQEGLLAALEAGARAEGLGSPADVADRLLADLVDNSGLLRGSLEQGYFFLHLTLHEFLASAALARSINEHKRGWQAKVKVGAVSVSAQHLVDHKSWDPRWQEVIVLLAGQLKDPDPLLALLADEERDDQFRHRLALAVRSVAELTAERQQQKVELVNYAVFEVLWRYYDDGTSDAVVHLMGAAQTLRYSDIAPAILGPLVDILTLGRHGGWGLPWETERKIGFGLMMVAALGKAAGVPQILACLDDMITHTHFAYAVIDAVRSIGSQAASPPILEGLAWHLCNSEDYDYVYRLGVAAGRAVEALGDAAATPEFFTKLKQRPGVYGQDSNMWRYLNAIARPRVLDYLVGLLSSEDDYDRSWALDMVGWLGSAPATPGILARLVDLLNRGETWEIEAALCCVKALGDAARTPDILAALANLLLNESHSIQTTARECLKGVGSSEIDNRPWEVAAKKPFFWQTERFATIDNKPWEGVEIIPQSFEDMAALLTTKDNDMRHGAAQEKAGFGAEAAALQFMHRIHVELSDKDWDVRRAAAQVIVDLHSKGVRFFHVGPNGRRIVHVTKLSQLSTLRTA